MHRQSGWRNPNIFRWLLSAAVALCLGAALWHSIRVGANFWLGSLRLSVATDQCDSEPRSAASADGNWLAAAWIKRTATSQGCTTGGQAVVRWATETAAMSDWGPISTLSLPSGACAVHTDVAVTGSTAHVVVSYWTPCNAGDADSGIRHFTCALDGGNCSLTDTAVVQAGSTNLRISDVRLAVDEQGRPHIAYARGTHALSEGDIMYTRWTGTAWSSPIVVSTGAKIDGFYRPVITAAGGRIHIAWERHRNLGSRSRGDVQYRYCNANTGACQPDLPLTYAYPSALLESTYPMPTIAARDGRVFLVWNVCADVDTNAPCSSFYLLYARSNDNGTSWASVPREVGTETTVTNITLSTRSYAGNDDGLDTSLASEYAASTRPAVILDPNLMPHIAWQVGSAQSYVITSTFAITGTSNSFTWTGEPTSQIGDGSDACIVPSIFEANPALDAEGTHYVFMRAWLEDAGGAQASRAQVYYDYRGLRTRTLVGGAPVGTRSLPEERAAVIGAQVIDAVGTPVSGANVTFATDFGSFDYDGINTHDTSAATDASGWASVTLYTNLPGSAAVDAWLDTTQNDELDAWEASVTQTRTWQIAVTPAIDIGASWVLAGDFMTATLTGHPYDTPEHDGRSTYYVLWWCPAPGVTGGVEAEVAGPWEMDVALWSRSTILRVPTLAENGNYVLKSYAESDVDDAEPCSDSARMAVSAEIDARADTPPAGTPWITVANTRPIPGTSVAATLSNHAAGNYALWWCPATDDSAPVQAQVGSVTVPATTPPTVTSFVVPSGSAGLYRLESHTGSGSCGNAGTRHGLSGLLSPASRIFLPLALRNARP